MKGFVFCGFVDDEGGKVCVCDWILWDECFFSWLVLVCFFFEEGGLVLLLWNLCFLGSVVDCGCMVFCGFFVDGKVCSVVICLYGWVEGVVLGLIVVGEMLCKELDCCVVDRRL